MAVVIVDLREQLADALKYCRAQRHHQDCRCNTYRDSSGEGFCSPQEATWNRAISKCLDKVLGRLV